MSIQKLKNLKAKHANIKVIFETWISIKLFFPTFLASFYLLRFYCSAESLTFPCKQLFAQRRINSDWNENLWLQSKQLKGIGVLYFSSSTFRNWCVVMLFFFRIDLRFGDFSFVFFSYTNICAFAWMRTSEFFREWSIEFVVWKCFRIVFFHSFS